MGGGFLVGGGGGGGLRGVPASKFLSDGGSGGGLERDVLMGLMTPAAVTFAVKSSPYLAMEQAAPLMAPWP